MNTGSIVSCICVSFNRPIFLRKAISHFIDQTYPHKEMVIVSAGHNPEYERIVSGYEGNAVRYYGLEAGLTLGALRNWAIEKSSGSYFCVWDDDDWYHADRIAIQISETYRGRKSGTILPYSMIYDSVNRVAYMSGPNLLAPASILCRKDVLARGARYEPANQNEDVYMFARLVNNNMLFPVVNPLLYIYVIHKTNTSFGSSEKLKRMLAGSTRLSPKLGKKIGDIVEGEYSCKAGSEMLENEDVYDELNYFGWLKEQYKAFI